MDFTDTAMSLDTALMEQNFSNYIQLYEYASTDGLLHIVAVNMFGDDLSKRERQSASFPEG